jgi:HD-GYP domain-containing protein (c-di-GMP phosphodiesterase class II)
MQKYNKYIEYVKNAFKNSFEKAGGNNYRFYHCINTANIAKYIAKELNLTSEEVNDIFFS